MDIETYHSNLKNQLVLTEDGSHTLLNKHTQEHYHSIHGAIQESKHVFILQGFLECTKHLKTLNILEIGFGTGLNAYLTLLENKKIECSVFYSAVEAYPIEPVLTQQLNYAQLLSPQAKDEGFELLHNCTWNTEHELNTNFIFQKNYGFIQDVELTKTFDLIYFDAFSPAVQPELWTEEIFKKLFSVLTVNGVLVTYCAKGEVKRNLKKAGFTVVGKPGPPGKREMTVAYK